MPIVSATTDTHTPAGACDAEAVRHSHFWDLMDAEFGQAYARTLASDLVVGDLDDRTAEQALALGTTPRAVWEAVCDAMQVPQERRWGPTERARRPAR